MAKRVNDPIGPALGRHVAELRRRMGMTQLQLANELGVEVGVIKHIEHGRCHVTSQRLLLLARALPGLTDTEPIPHFLPMRDFWERSNESPQRVLHSGTERQKIAGILGINDLSNLGLYAWNTLTDQVHRDPALKLLMGLPADASPNLSVWKERIRWGKANNNRRDHH